MITEIVKFSIPEDMLLEDVVAGFESTAITWRENPDLIRKNYLVDVESRTAGGVYLWESREAAEAMYMPFRTPILPTSRPGCTCWPNMAFGTSPSFFSANAPSSIMIFAPPGNRSSLG